MILISNSVLTLDFPSRDALSISFASAFSEVTESHPTPISSPRESGYATKTQAQRRSHCISSEVFWTSYPHGPEDTGQRSRGKVMSLACISYHDLWTLSCNVS